MVTWLRLTGYLPPSHSATPAFLDLLDGLGHFSNIHSSSKKGKTVLLKRSEVHEIVQSYNSYECTGVKIEAHQVQPVGTLLDSVTSIRNHHKITWNTEENDASKPTKSHNVCWLCCNLPFSKYRKVQNLEDFKAGKIKGLIEVKIGGRNMTFARIQQLETLSYDFGGIWTCNTVSTSPVFVNLECLSVPLITAKCEETICFLNSCIYHEPSEARSILNLITPLGR